MNEIEAKIAVAKLVQQERIKGDERLAQVAHAVFSTADGKELLAHLCQRFDLTGRTFLPGEKGDVNALRAACRDGERAVVNHLITLCRRANKDFPIPL